MDKLKPCPFCGGKARIRTVLNDNFVECGNCWSHGPHVLGFNMTKEQAISAWNRCPKAKSRSEIIKGLWKLYDKYEDAEHVICGDAARLLQSSLENKAMNCEGCKHISDSAFEPPCDSCMRLKPDWYTTEEK
ncbi:Lar family restriction alleviation protein [Caproicibacterium sp. BJN0003]|uniref:Lar family restriction alleviation protein n=1 Tax=Caproicibacterium sp. BJN0003 TaxID=2994078 RepID=UPI0022573466|nr:Lar family restriction alleviation protein [Caproicibacterium sp. BJN0003]UZT82116.1 Lar family restriction alleviation protein [Caproicibacterium sp. BJN0003]